METSDSTNFQQLVPGSFQSVAGNLAGAENRVPTQDSKPLLALFHMHGCRFCQGLPGNSGAMANAADGLVKYKEIESQHPVMDKLAKMFSGSVQVQGFPTIAIVTPSQFLVYKGVDRSVMPIRQWVKNVLSWIDQQSK